MFSKAFVINFASTVLRYRRGAIAGFCLLASVAAVALVHSSPATQWSPSLITTAIPAVAENACVPPGLTVVTDSTGDQTAGVTGATSSHDITAVSIAEQYPNGGLGQLVVTMKVASLSSDPPQNTNWRTFF